MTVAAGMAGGLAAAADAAEQAFLAGDAAAARRLLEEIEPRTHGDRELRLRVLNDLAVIAAGEGREADAESLLLAVLALDPRYAPALENLADLRERAGDLVQASHWRRRAAEASPGAPAGWRALANALNARRRFAEALDALRRAQALDPLDPPGEALLAELERRVGDARRPSAGPLPEGGRALIVVDYFHPSVGGSERLAESAGVALQEHGWEVEVATRRLPERDSREHRGMRVHEVDGDPRAALAAIVAAGSYDALAIFSAPTSWPLAAALQLPRPRPRLVPVPCINAENHGLLQAQPGLLASYASLLAGADAVGYSSLSGYDVRLCEQLGIEGVYLPNASDPPPPAAPFRESLGIDDARPLLLAVGNMWPEKNHAGLLRALAAHWGDWRLVLIGSPSPKAPHVADEVRALAQADPRVVLLGGAPPATVAAAMREADALLLPSLAEATPLVLLEAMACGTPWIATPTCGSAHDHAGGLILPLELFGEGVDFLLEDSRAARELGEAGRRHWRASYTWEVMGPRYARVLAGVEPGPLEAPSDALAATDEIRARFYDGRAGA